MKKKILFMFLLVLSGLLFSCQAKKTFSKMGVTITLTEQFIEKEVLQAPFYLESTQHIFMANREAKSSLGSIDTLEEYINAVLSNASKTAEVKLMELEDRSYMYAYYESTVGEQTFGYMLLVFEGESHFYTMNFGCFSSNLEKNKDQYFKWAETIVVE